MTKWNKSVSCVKKCGIRHPGICAKLPQWRWIFLSNMQTLKAKTYKASFYRRRLLQKAHKKYIFHELNSGNTSTSWKQPRQYQLTICRWENTTITVAKDQPGIKYWSNTNRKILFCLDKFIEKQGQKYLWKLFFLRYNL